VREVDFSNKSERRRSERVSQSIPLIVRGIDLLGQPFEESTSTLVVNLHGCRYSSKRHMSKNAWVTLGLRDGSEIRNTRARIAWVQRPQTIRDFFEVAVELESPGNIWGMQRCPENWGAVEASALPHQPVRWEETPAGQTEGNRLPVIIGTIEANVISNSGNENPSFSGESAAPLGRPPQTLDQSPLLRDLTAELHRQAAQAMQAAAAQASEDFRRLAQEADQNRTSTAEEFFQNWKNSLEQAHSEARNDLSAHLSAKQEEFLTELRSQFEERFAQAKTVLQDLEHHTRTARDLQNDLAARAEQPRQQRDEPAPAGQAPIEREPGAERWRERLHLELALAETQWKELLESSLDNGIERLALQLSQRSQDMIRNAEERIANRFAELRQPLAETSAEARDALNGMRSELEHEMTRARSSLVEIEQVVSRLKDYSGQLEVSSHDTLNELHRRLENILDGHTREMNRHAESLVAGMSDRLNPTFDSLGSQLVERTTAEVESRLAPYLDRVPALIRDLSVREMQAEESLRLHRERLRQLSENSQRDVSAQISGALSALHNDFDSARTQALAKWNEELSATTARASQSVSESIGQTSEWLQNEARARLQVVGEQVLATAKSNCDEINSQAAQKFVDDVAARSSTHLQHVQQQLEDAAGDVGARSRSTLDEAASAAAASFGQVLQTIAANESEHFVAASRDILQKRTEELERVGDEVFGNLTLSSESAFLGFRNQVEAQVETSVAGGRNALTAELASMLERFDAEGAAKQQEWAQGLERLSEEATGKHQERLQTACDTWLVSSVRRLNEHGQNIVESLMRSAEQSLRDSCSKVFEGLAETMRGRPLSNGGFPAHAQATGRDVTENTPS
jgi:hypothetical protein